MFKKLLLILLVVFTCCVGVAVSQKKIVCFYTNWAQYRPDGGKFLPENINPNLCTHIIYAFSKVDGDKIAPYEWNDEDTPWSKGMFSRVIALKNQNPNLKILLAVGGFTMGGEPFSRMVHSSVSRSNFVRNTVDYLKKFSFDGLDLDWEYPGASGGKPTDKGLFTVLIRELKQAFTPHNLLLTASISAGIEYIDQGYEIDQISKDLDFINVMTYDLHGPWEQFVGHNAPLYPRKNEQGYQLYTNIDFGLSYLFLKSAPREKLILGLAPYGHTYRLAHPTQNKPGDKAIGPGSQGPMTGSEGFLSYYEICTKLNQGWTRKWDSESRAPYIYKDTEWIGYDDFQSLSEKVGYLKAKGLGGVFFWTLDLDDFNGQYCGLGRYPFINYVKSLLNDQSTQTTATATPTTQTTATATPTTQTTTTTTTKTTTITTTTKTTTTTTTTTTTKQSTTTAKTTALPVQTTTISASSGVLCFNGDGFYPDRSSGCQKFYRCVYQGTIFAKIYEYTCPTETLFSSSLLICIWKDQVIC